MGTSRTLNKTVKTRPKKKPAERRRREATQKKRLIALGMDEATVAKMTSKQVREHLKRPALVAE